ELDNRGSHFYIALYWAQALAAQDKDADLKATFAPVAEKLASQESEILAELASGAGKAVDLNGYYFVDADKVAQAMRPSVKLNAVIDAL
ncbi:MAG: NADP-dependent isocitrate dehydrogenase, partial [Alysiella sp.]|uniref:NADP-dependent isocitrate dehydrogenase n=1 Tax=Alysiella sp. TaxID=1872483 RepID=UPI0026DD74D6